MKYKNYKYTGFISYTHQAHDKKWAKWLIKSLESYRVPRNLVTKGYPKRLGKFYRDEDEYSASSNLTDSIKSALSESYCLIAICSTNTQSSKWVEEEVLHFKSINAKSNVLALLISGEPEIAYPRPLIGITKDSITMMPAAADVRPTKKYSKRKLKQVALLRIVSGILGCSFDDLMKREKRRKRKKNVITILSFLVFSLFAYAISGFAINSTKTLGENHSKELSRIAKQALNNGEVETAQRLAVLAATETIFSPSTNEANAALLQITASNKLLSYLDTEEMRQMDFGDPNLAENLMRNTIEHAVFDPSATMVASLHQDGVIRIWDVASSQILLDSIQHIENNPGEFSFSKGVKFINSGTELASWDGSGTVRIWDAKTGAQIRGPIYTNMSNIDDIHISSKSNILVVTDAFDGRTVWNIESTKQITPLSSDGLIRTEHESLTFPSGNYIAEWFAGEKIALFNTKTKEYDFSINLPLFELEGWNISDDQEVLMFWGVQNKDDQSSIIGVLNIASNKIRTEVLHNSQSIISANLSDSGEFVIIEFEEINLESKTEETGMFQLWETKDLSSIGDIFRISKFYLDKVVWSPNANWAILAGVSENNSTSTTEMFLVDTTKGSQYGNAMSHRDHHNLDGIKFSSDGRKIYSWRYDTAEGEKGVKWTWDLDTQKLATQPYRYNRTGLKRLLFSKKSDQAVVLGENYLALEHDGSFTGLTTEGAIDVVYSDDGTKLLSWISDEIKVWDSSSFRKLNHPGSVYSAYLDSKHDRVISLGDDGQLVSLSTNDQESLPRIIQDAGKSIQEQCQFELVSSVSRIIYYCKGGSIAIFDSQSFQALLNVELNSEVYGYSISENEEMVSFFSKDGSIKLYSLDNGDSILGSLSHKPSVSGVWGASFFQGDTRLLTWGGDNAIRVWDVITGEKVGQVFEHENPVAKVHVFEKLRRLVSCTEFGKVTLWDMDSGLAIPEASSSLIQPQKDVCGTKIGNENQMIFQNLSGLEIFDISLNQSVGIISASDLRLAMYLEEPNKLLVRNEDTISTYDLEKTHYYIVPKVGEDLHLRGESFVIQPSQSGKRVALILSSGLIKVLDSNLNDISTVFSNNVKWAIIDDKSNQLMSWAHDGALKIWSLPKAETKAELLKRVCDKKLTGELSELNSQDTDLVRSFRENMIGFDVCKKRRGWFKIFR